eukprot:2823471-Amphidinium_carterae.6
MFLVWISDVLGPDIQTKRSTQRRCSYRIVAVSLCGAPLSSSWCGLEGQGISDSRRPDLRALRYKVCREQILTRRSLAGGVETTPLHLQVWVQVLASMELDVMMAAENMISTIVSNLCP